MELKIGFCRIETKQFGVTHGEITEIFDDFVLFNDYGTFPPILKIEIKKSEFLQYEPVKEEDIPPYE